MKVIVAVADPERDGPLLETADALANGGEVVLASVIEVTGDDTLASAQPEARGRRRMLDALAAQAGSRHARSLVTVARVGWEAIRDACASERADLLVVGWRRPGWDLLGTTIEEILRDPPCDVAVVKGQPARARRILVPVRGGRYAQLAARVGIGLAKADGASVTLLHVADREHRTSLYQLLGDHAYDDRVERLVTRSGDPVRVIKEELAQRRGAPQIIGEDPRLKQVSQALHRAATTDNTTVLIEGESGTGKELFARALHVLSARADGPFVAINCAAIPENLLESELFGYEKGAFTGAAGRKPGRFELAHRGTLFLDEIGDLPLGLQAKILRALEEKSFDRVGGTVPLCVDVRVVAATNRGLKAAVAARQFREDLYFRLSVFPITIPPLRERPDDITLLARYFIDKYCRDMNKKPLTLAPSAEQAMKDYPWPGNVRELQNCVERAVILSEGDTIRASQLSLTFRAAPSAAGAAEEPNPWGAIDLSGSLAEATKRIVADVERRKIEQALKEADGNRLRAAELLQISQKAFLSKLKEHGLETN